MMYAIPVIYKMLHITNIKVFHHPCLYTVFLIHVKVLYMNMYNVYLFALLTLYCVSYTCKSSIYEHV